MFFYSDTSGPDRPNFDISRVNATKAYLRHYDNYLFLHFVTKNKRASEIEKRQARKELDICERKLNYWKKHPNYVHEEALRGVEKRKREWKS